MPDVSDGDIFLFAADARLDGQQLLLTQYYRAVFNTPESTVNYLALIDEWHDATELLGAMSAVIAGIYSEDVVNINYWYQKIDPIRLVKQVRSSVNGTGTVASPSLPPGTANVITMRGDIATRRQVGSKHLGGVPSSFSEDGLVTAAGRTAYQLLIDNILGPPVLTLGEVIVTMNPVIFHRAEPSTSALSTSGYVQDTTRTEKRRVVGRGT